MKVSFKLREGQAEGEVISLPFTEWKHPIPNKGDFVDLTGISNETLPFNVGHVSKILWRYVPNLVEITVDKRWY